MLGVVLLLLSLRLAVSVSFRARPLRTMITARTSHRLFAHRPSRVISLLEQKPLQLLPETADEMFWIVAFVQDQKLGLEMDLERKKRLDKMELREATRKLEEEKNKVIREIEDELSAKDAELRFLDRCRKHQLAFFSQRFLLEVLFKEVFETIRCDEEAKQLLATSSTSIPQHLFQNLSADSTPFRTVYELLSIAEAREILWDKLRLPRGCPFPQLSEEVLYGGLNTLPFNPAHDKVFISERIQGRKITTPEDKEFFNETASLFGLELEEFSERDCYMNIF